VVNGGKKPCTMSRSMDLLTASIALPTDDGAGQLGVLLIPADSPGVSVHPFWASWPLAASESDEVRLQAVHVPESLIIRTAPDDLQRLDDLQTSGFIWFELLITSAYIGAVSSLVEWALQRGRGSVTDRASAGVLVESTVTLTEGVARAVRDGLNGDEAVAAVLVARFAAQESLAAASDLAAELLGGIAYMQSPDIAYLTAVARPLVYHPPSRSSTAQALVDYFGGKPLLLA